jgi:hypothetical protein
LRRLASFAHKGRQRRRKALRGGKLQPVVFIVFVKFSGASMLRCKIYLAVQHHLRYT